jgi:hypothetical protein
MSAKLATKRLVIALGLALTAAPAVAGTLLVQSGQDSSPYAFTPNLARGFRNTAYAFTNSLDGVDHSFQYYIQFALPAELFEPDVVVESAYAWIYYGYDYTIFGDTTAEVGQIECRAVLAPWSQATLSWNNRPPVGPVFDGWDDITARGMYWCDVTELVQGWIDGSVANDGIAITSGARRVIGFYTWDDATVGPNFKPSLLVETLPEPSFLAGLLAGGAVVAALRRRRASPIRSPRFQPRRTR